MIKLPVIVGIGGMNASGRSSGFHGYKRMVCDVLSEETLASTWSDLRYRMGMDTAVPISDELIQAMKEGTLVRRIECFNPDQVTCHHKATIEAVDHPVSLRMKKAKLPDSLAHHADVELLDDHEVRVKMTDSLDVLLSDKIKLPVSSGGNLPRGFDPAAQYHSPHHPRGLQLAVYGASDALNSLGIDWDEVLRHVKPDEVAVYGGSALGQIDEDSLAGLIAQPLCGHRINSKMMALSLAEMPADFVNSYILNSVGSTGNTVGACATFLYNLQRGVQDIQEGRAKVVMVGCAEAPLVPEIMEGFRVMGALATDESLCVLDQTDTPNHRRACRPFSTNTGFTLAEASQFVMLMDDTLALTLGAEIYGSVADVFIHADANKKSIASPGIGNYITVAKAAALAKAILGEEGVKQTYVQAHGTGTPQNRTTESHILNEVAKTFGIDAWPVSAVKSYVGHSVGAAGGDQLMSALGVWQYGWIPGIQTIDHVASDVYQSHLSILQDHLYVGERGQGMRGVIINSKGFGGNNASALVLSPDETLALLEKRHGSAKMRAYHDTNKAVRACRDALDGLACEGKERIVYSFGESVMDQTSVVMTQETVSLSAFATPISLPNVNPYEADESLEGC